MIGFSAIAYIFLSVNILQFSVYGWCWLKWHELSRTCE
jgi:hypothetical protein